MLTPNKRLKIILKEKNLTTSDIAKELGVNRSTISQWLSDNSKFKKLHIYAISYLLNIDRDIFLNKNIDTKEKLIKYLNNNVILTNSDGLQLFSNFNDKWYLYFYSHIDSEIVEYIVNIDNNKKVIIKNSEQEFIGLSECLYNHTIVKTYNKKYTGSLMILAFNSERLKDTILNVSIITKSTVSFRYIVAFGLLSKKALSKEKVKFILGLKNENFLLNPKDKRDKIINVLYNKDNDFYTNLYDEYHIFESLIGKWHFYTKKSQANLIIEINKSHQVSFFRDNVLASKGEIYVNIFHSTIRLKNKQGISSYFSFKSNTNPIKVCCFRTTLHLSDTNVIGIGLISKKPLDIKFLKEFFDDNDYIINVDKYHYKLFDILTKK